MSFISEHSNLESKPGSKWNNFVNDVKDVYDTVQSTGVLNTARALFNPLGYIGGKVGQALRNGESVSTGFARGLDGVVDPYGLTNSDMLQEKVLRGVQQYADDHPGVQSVVDVLTPDGNQPTGYYGSAVSGVRPSSGTSHLVYQDAPYAQAYNMSRETAYQEALANTSHQREVADLRAAGLNPVLSANGGSGASVFGGTVYSPGTSAVASGGYSGSSKSKSLDLGNVIKNVSLLAGAALSLSGKGAAGRAVSTAGRAVDGLLDAFVG